MQSEKFPLNLRILFSIFVDISLIVEAGPKTVSLFGPPPSCPFLVSFWAGHAFRLVAPRIPEPATKDHFEGSASYASLSKNASEACKAGRKVACRGFFCAGAPRKVHSPLGALGICVTQVLLETLAAGVERLFVPHTACSNERRHENASLKFEEVSQDELGSALQKAY